MSALEPHVGQCPYCWEEIELVIDCTVDEQEYVEDCSVCCQPILVQARIENDLPQVNLLRENE